VAQLHVLRVFTNEDGEWGNRLGVFLEGGQIPDEERQQVAADLGFSETVFVDDPAAGEVRIFTPEVEFSFAGHPLVGSGWLLGETGQAPQALRPPAGEVGLRNEGGTTFISARPEWSPPFEEIHLDDPAEVRNLAGPRSDADEAYCWAWIDEAAGTIRARCFAPGVGVPEDEATGSAALALCGRLGRPITVIQGKGSVLVAQPLEQGLVEVGGRVALDEQREYRV
jgi:predicted PhzF superfamily epimerase YddE/YHI9